MTGADLPSASCLPHPRCALHSFPTRRSSDLTGRDDYEHSNHRVSTPPHPPCHTAVQSGRRRDGDASRFVETYRDRKSTRLNSSHRCISYAVFCLKKKKQPTEHQGLHPDAVTL